MRIKYLYIHTIGCQMNVYDSDRMAGLLKPSAYKKTAELESADLVIVNTCAIREKAEQKVYSFLGRLNPIKRENPDLIVAVGGCVAQQEGARMLERVPHLDLVFGTHAIGRLPKLIEQIETKRCRIVDVAMTGGIEELNFSVKKPLNGDVTRFVTIMQGCDNYCTYCVVPYVRGAETSRSPEKIIKEIQGLVDCGVKEVTLLGQNVNSYGIKEGLLTFPRLLERINDIDGLWRIRFTTSHPKDLSDELIQAFNDLEKLCKHIHLPVQSGSNRVLKRMNRRYTREMYLEKVSKLRHTYPGIAITSDIIVGFPGETLADFKETLDLIKSVEFDSLYAFKYSDRPNAAATRFAEKVADEDKKDRLQAVLDLQKQYTILKNKALVGSIQKVLVEGYSKKHHRRGHSGRQPEIQWSGRTSTHKIVNFLNDDNVSAGLEIYAGSMADIKITQAFPNSLRGKPVGLASTHLSLRGEETYVA